MLIWIVRILIVLAGPLIAYFQVESTLQSAFIGLSISTVIVIIEYAFQKTPLDTLVIAIIGIVMGLIAAKIVDYGAFLLGSDKVDLFFEKYSLLIKFIFSYMNIFIKTFC